MSRIHEQAARSSAWRRVVAEAKQLARGDAPLVLLGETGVGKEWLARYIHDAGPRGAGPFVVINCAGVPETLFESELFGHERGAFTGAERQRRGHFELADGGTLFLDEIGETPLHLQAKLLRAVDRGEVQRLGGEAPVAVDVRILAATNRDLDADVAAGRFRRDLYYRLAVTTLTLPPLRERRADVASLAEEFLRGARKYNRRLTGFEAEALHALESYRWPGNVRELRGVVERAVQLAEGPRVTAADLPLRVVAGAGPARALTNVLRWPEDRWLERTLPELRDELMAALERDYLRAQLRHTGGDLAATARRAGISPRALYDKMRQHGLDKRQFRGGAAGERERGRRSEGE